MCHPNRKSLEALKSSFVSEAATTARGTLPTAGRYAHAGARSRAHGSGAIAQTG